MSLFATFHGTADAQSRSAGTVWALSGVGLSFEYESGSSTFMQAVVQFEMAESFLGRRGDTGISCSLTWNNIIGRTETDDGNEVLFHAGPGIMAGYCKDFRFRNEPAPYGIAFGLQGKAGVTIIYDRNISISICVAPVIGFHLTRTGEELNMNYYKYGLLRVLMPEIGIKYRF